MAFLKRSLLKVSASSFCRFSSTNTGKVFELRTYSIKPECMKPFLDLTFDKFHIRTQFSKLHGYWTAEIGGINQVVHIWEYDNYLHRADVRKALASNQDWIEQYFGKILPMMSQQTNVGMESMVRPSKPDIFYPQNPGVYELWTMKSQNYVYRGVKELLNSLENQETEGSKLCGAFKGTFGSIGTTYFLWQHPNFDEAQKLRTIWVSNQSTKLESTTSFDVKALTPLKISPLQ